MNEKAAPKHPLHMWAHRERHKMKWVCDCLGVTRTALHLWAHRRGCPSPLNMKRIEALTAGAVTPSDCINYYLED